MILWTIKLINSVRKAIAGRKHPSQLAWGVALGALVGIIPHGNLLAVVLVLLVLTLRVNHAMVALVGIAVTMLASRLDPTFDTVGRWFFEQPRVAAALATLWQYPLIAWTDLNNTVVMGSFLIGLVALVPLYLIANPLFKIWAPTEEESDSNIIKVQPVRSRKKNPETSNQPLHRIDSQHDSVQPNSEPRRKYSDASPVHPGVDGSPAVATSGRVYDVRRIDDGAPVSTSKPPLHHDRETNDRETNEPTAVKTPVDSTPDTTSPQRSRSTRVAINAEAASPRVANPRAATQQHNPKPGINSDITSADDQHKIDEALSYLLRQLRDSQDKDAA